MRVRLLSQVGEGKKNLLFNQLIKKYKYVNNDVSEPVKHENILKKGRFKDDELSTPGSLVNTIQKKKVISSSDYRMSSPASQTTSVSTIDKTVSSDKKDTNSNKKNQNLNTKQNSSVDSIGSKALIHETKIREKYDTLVKIESEKSYNDGFQEGKARADQVSQIVNSISSEFEKASEHFFRDMENVVLDLSVHLAGKIIGEAVSMIPDIVKSNVEKCVNLLAGGGNVMIKINPGDYEVIKECLPNLDQKHEGKYSFILEPDHNISRGGCLIELDGSVIDGRIETQFEKLKKHMEMLS